MKYQKPANNNEIQEENKILTPPKRSIEKYVKLKQNDLQIVQTHEVPKTCKPQSNTIYKHQVKNPYGFTIPSIC